MGEPFVVPPGGGTVLDLGTFEVAVLATAAQTHGAFTVLQTQQEPPEFGPPMHIHHDAAEVFYVLEGEYLMFFDGREEVCPPGSFVYVPRGVAHTFRVVSTGAGKKLNLFAPAAMVGFFEALAAAEVTQSATPDLVDAVAAAHHMEVVGPVPDSYLRPRT